MRLPEYTPTLYRRLRLALFPFRLAGCALALWACWVIYARMEATEYGPDTVSNVALAFVNGLLTGVHVALAIVLAVFVWWPLPDPDSRW